MKAHIVTAFIVAISLLFANQALADATWVTFLPGYPEGTAPVVNVVTSDENHAVVEIITPGMWVEEKEEGGEVYDFLTLPECSYESEEGFPMLPHVVDTLGVPGEKGVYLSVLNKTTIELDDYFVCPVQLEQLWGEPAPPFYRNDYFYTLDDYYPPIDAGLGEASIWRDLRIVNPVFFPIRFNPAQRRLEVATQVRYELIFDGPSENNVKPDPEYAIEKEYADAYRETVINYDYLGLEEIGWLLGEGSYLILARASLHSHLQTLITWLSQKGFSVDLIDPQTLEGGNTALSIKSAISKHYEGKRTKYVLLVGHANPNGAPATYIPTAIVKPYYSPWYRPDPNDDIASDFWYSLIDGDDMFPELAVGRIDLTTIDDAVYAITKIINYEKNVVGGTWPKNSLLVADDNTWAFYPDPDDIKEAIRKHHYVEPSPNFITCYGGEGKTNEYIEYNINAGFGIVNYNGHGNRYGWADWNTIHESWTNYEIANLDNDGRTPVVFNLCCYAASIDAGPNMASIWLYTPGRAAAAAIGSTRISWIGENGDLDYYLFTSMFDHKLYRVGDVLNHAKCDVFKENHGWVCAIPGKEKDIAMMYLLIGEPSMDVRTRPSLGISCMHVQSVPVAVATPVQIEVKDNVNALPIPDAVVCLYKEGDVHKAYTTDNNGIVNFEITPASKGDITVTVTKHGYVPNQTIISVTD